MSNHLKLLTKNYLKRHPVKQMSAARLEYSMLLVPDVMDLVDENLPKLRAMGVDIPDTTELMEKIAQEEVPQSCCACSGNPLRSMLARRLRKSC